MLAYPPDATILRYRRVDHTKLWVSCWLANVWDRTADHFGGSTPQQLECCGPVGQPSSCCEPSHHVDLPSVAEVSPRLDSEPGTTEGARDGRSRLRLGATCRNKLANLPVRLGRNARLVNRKRRLRAELLCFARRLWSKWAGRYSDHTRTRPKASSHNQSHTPHTTAQPQRTGWRARARTRPVA